MTIASVDAHGAFIDTGTSTLVAPRANTEVEFHTASENAADTGGRFSTITTLTSSHVPHRGPGNPR